MHKIHLPLTNRLTVAAAALIAIITTGIATSATHHRAEVRRMQADIRLIDSATAKLALH